jgi:hypothetical protein
VVPTKRQSILLKQLSEPTLWVGFLIGALVGTIIALPILGTQLDSGFASLIGTAAGSALAVIGAIWLWVLREKLAQSSLSGTIEALLLPLYKTTLELQNDAHMQAEHAPIPEGSCQQRIDRIEAIPKALRFAHKRLKRIHSHFVRLDLEGASALIRVEDAIDALKENSELKQYTSTERTLKNTIVMQVSGAESIGSDLDELATQLKSALDYFCSKK